MLVDWLAFDGAETIEMPRFSEHNGQSAKRRAEDQKRKRDARSEKKDVRNLSENDADKSGLEREEKRREHRGTPLCPATRCAPAGRPGGGRRAESICACPAERRSSICLAHT